MSSNCNCAQQAFAELEKVGIDATLLEPVFDKYGKIEGSLITILQHAQDIYGYLPIVLLNYIAIKTGIKPAKVLGVATFYAQFRLEPVGKYLIMLCQGTACHVNGSVDIETAVCEELNIKEGETTPDGLFTLNNVACLGCCSLSPVMMINGETYGTLTPTKAKEIIAEIKAKEAE
ncbi:MAG TPA: NADH-quinone oxidoreductase subunit NuoE [Lachnospiraceae bacterium]|nr:NADH-quinone oxidoreductase subunit NuoE [Lachnospiraceae bacterium]